jgi:chemotaxis protein methyltransferase CheR
MDVVDDRVPPLTQGDFERLRAFVLGATGIHLAPGKQHLVASRLWSRLRALQLRSFEDYVRLVTTGEQGPERDWAIDALTTHETSFFREAQHFPSLVEHARRHRGPRRFRVWSAACSTGEEAFSVAMLLAGQLAPGTFEVIGTDVSLPSVEAARRALYPLERASTIPPELLRRYCRKGTGAYEGSFIIEPTLRQHVSFLALNLCEPPPPSLGQFDVALLRNVLIYLEPAEKQTMVRHVVDHLVVGGLLLNGHAESVTGLNPELEPVVQTVHRKRARSAS